MMYPDLNTALLVTGFAFIIWRMERLDTKLSALSERIEDIDEKFDKRFFQVVDAWLEKLGTFPRADGDPR